MFRFQINQILFWVHLSFYFVDFCLRSWPTKLVNSPDNVELKIVLLSILIHLLSHKHCQVTVDSKYGRDENCFPDFIKISPWHVNSSLILLGIMHKFEWKIYKSFYELFLYLLYVYLFLLYGSFCFYLMVPFTTIKM